VEKDPWLASELRARFEDYKNIDVIEGDILNTNLPSFNKVVATPPYYLSSKLILFLTKRKFELASLVLQKEFGLRLSANPGTAGYGRLSVLSNRNFDVEVLRNIPRSAFRPSPKVDSVLVRLAPKRPSQKLDEQFFEELVRGLFTQRRRLVRSALNHFLKLRMGPVQAKRVVEQVTVPDSRVYQLSVDELEKLATELSNATRQIRV
jgi:16S rRNA (adenine1518-N6/adenine1519-N6)-dimethyltransferase